MRRSISLSLIGLSLLFSACGHGAGTDSLPSAGTAPDSPAARVAPATTAATSRDPIYKVPVDGLPSIGHASALVTMIAFTDYQCPYCKRVEATVTQLRAKYGAALRVVVAEHPLPMHDRARSAALAALAANEQGQLEAMRAKLYAGPLDDASIEQAARDVGLDVARFDADRAGMAVTALGKSDALATRLSVKGTPSFFVNGRRIVGAQPLEVFEDVIEERLAAARALVANGTRPSDVYAQTIATGRETVAETGDEGGSCQGGEHACKGDDEVRPVGPAEQVPVDGAPARGPARAAITVVEFSDYECPFCAKAEPILQSFEAAHPGQVRVVFKNLPLPFHANARLAARAAIAAEAQGQFWPMHDALFARKGSLDAAAIEKAAADLGLDMARFDRDLADPKTEARVASDEADAAKLDVKGTPSFFVNGHRVIGAQPLAVLETAAKAR
jgi:protein-disulfide isomerase